MKFITEEYLRDLYKKEPFNTYKLNEGERFTPGASQYLSDRGIKRWDDASYKNKNIPLEKKTEVVLVENKKLKKKLCNKLKSMEAVFLVTSREMLKEDIILAQDIVNLGKKITLLRNVVEGKGVIENLSCQKCTGINSDNFCKDIDDCFEITEFHMQLKMIKEVLKLHVLRCNLREIEPVVIEVYGDYDNDNKIGNKIIKNINSIINSLSQMICSIIGGEKCQRKI